MLEDKIEYSINRIRKAEGLALALNPNNGMLVAFSGGKDSQCVLELVKMAGVKYHAVYNVTFIDRATNIKFMKDNYPEVQFSISDKSFFKLVEKKGLPTRLTRWCCERYKERFGAGNLVLTGVRAQESAKRAQYEELQKYTKNKDKRKGWDIDTMQEHNFECVNGRDKFMLSPIFHWSTEDVWTFIKQRKLPINPCYKDSERVGCVFCPMARKGEIERYLSTRPALKRVFLQSIEQYRMRGSTRFESAEDMYQWWLSKDSVDVYFAKKSQKKFEFDTTIP